MDAAQRIKFRQERRLSPLNPMASNSPLINRSRTPPLYKPSSLAASPFKAERDRIASSPMSVDSRNIAHKKSEDSEDEYPPKFLMKLSSSVPELRPLSAEKSAIDRRHKRYIDQSRQAKRLKKKKKVEFVDWKDNSAVGLGLDITGMEQQLPPLNPLKSTHEVRSLSDGDLSEHLKIFTEMRQTIQSAKNICDRDLQSLLHEMNDHVENNMDNFAVPVDDTEFSLMAAITELSNICTEIIQLDLLDLLNPIVSYRFIANLQELQSAWKKEWPCLEYLLRTLLIFSTVTRLVEHLQEDTRLLKYIDMKNRTARMRSLQNADETEDEDQDDIARGRAKKADRNRKIRPSNPASSVDSRKSSPMASPQIFYARGQSPLSRVDSPTHWAISEWTPDPNLNMNIMLEMRTDFTISYISPNVADIFGFNPREIVGTTSLPFIDQENSNGDSAGKITVHYTWPIEEGEPTKTLAIPCSEVFQKGTEFLMDDKVRFVHISYQAYAKDGALLDMEGQGTALHDTYQSAIWVTRGVSHPLFPSLDVNEASESESNSILDENANDFTLCHICDRTVPLVAFEDHTAICSDIHRAESGLSLCNDTLKGMLEPLEEKIQIVNEELSRYSSESLSSSNLDLFKVHLIELKRFLKLYWTRLEEILSVKVAGIFDGEFQVYTNLPGRDINALKKSIEAWEDPNESKFFDLDPFSQLDPNVAGLGLGALRLFQDMTDQAKNKLNFIDQCSILSRDYKECIVREEDVKVQIGIETGKLFDKLDLLRADMSTSVHELDGMLINTDAVASSFDSQGASADPGRLTPGRSARSPGLFNISTGPTGPTGRRASMRPPRMVLGGSQKTFDIEQIQSPIISSPRGSRFFGEQDLADSLHSKSHSLTPSGSGLSRNLPSIKDFDIVKPISKGAFGSVYLAKKKVTDEYYAIKVLKKSDMVAKNQVTNIKAERMILTQLDSPFVVKMYFSFQSKNNLYLVMEYLNGGDCAALIKAVGSLDERWTRQYIAEIVLGLEFLHSRGIIHRYII